MPWSGLLWSFVRTMTVEGTGKYSLLDEAYVHGIMHGEMALVLPNVL
jgi:hypothetical protein